jgi:hypothetical protein
MMCVSVGWSIKKMLKKFINWLKYHLSHEWCYDRMEKEGIAIFGCCCGVVGGGKQTNYLSETCMGCPYWTPIDRERKYDGK